jgi:hypothetical protein
MRLLLTDEELEALQELYMDMEPEQVDAVESHYMAGIAEQRAIAVWDKVAARLKRPE